VASVDARGFYRAIKQKRALDPEEFRALLSRTDQERVEAMSESVWDYLESNLPQAIRSKSGLADYRTNPYVLMTTASTMRLADPLELAAFLVNLKLYMGLETSFGKQVESAVVGHYPIDADVDNRWAEPAEKREEFARLAGLSQEEKAIERVASPWREIDQACVNADRRHLVSIKDDRPANASSSCCDGQRLSGRASSDERLGGKNRLCAQRLLKATRGAFKDRYHLRGRRLLLHG
jgi:hypothetical protein